MTEQRCVVLSNPTGKDAVEIAPGCSEDAYEDAPGLPTASQLAG
jgi:hypothetical protein